MQDGKISREELKLGFAKLGEALSDADATAIMTLADGDGDGKLDYSEFVKMGQATISLQLEVNEFRGDVQVD